MPAGYGLIVIGGGAAGLGAARAGAAAGARTLLVSEGEIGGECTFTGCVPSKTLIEAAARGAAFPGAMTAVRDAVAAIAATETAEVLAREGIEVLRGRAAFTHRARSGWTGAFCGRGGSSSPPGHGLPCRPYRAWRIRIT